jgi:hypothetical protein
VSGWTAKKAAILGLVFSGTSVAFLFATAVAMNWQHGSGGHKDWGMVFGVAFGVPFMCCTVAALLRFFVSVTHHLQTTFRNAAGFARAVEVTGGVKD